MWKTILLVVAVAVGAFLIFAWTRPGSFRVERTTAIKAPPEKIYPFIADFHRWTAWSPWENIDPDLKRSYSGADSGKGAAYAWEGNNKVGSGRMEITEAASPSKLKIALDFLKPFEAHNIAEFTLQPSADGTTVTWAMYGPSPFVAKVMGIFMSMDSMVGGMFENGLANLKAAAEKAG